MPTPMQLLASLMSQKSSNIYDDINNPVIRPPVIPNQPYVGTPWGTPPTVVNPPGPAPGGTGGANPNDPSGSGRGGTAPGSGGYGAMTSDQRATLGNIAGAFGLGGMFNPGLAATGWGLRAALANDKYGITGPPGVIGITARDVQDAYDYEGNVKGAQRAADRAEQEAAREAALGKSFAGGIMGGALGPKGPGETPESPTDTESGANGPGGPGAGWGSSTPSSGFGAGEEAGGGTGGGAAGGAGDGTGTGSAGGSGGDGSTGGDTRRLGGVRKASGKETITTKWGEPSTGGETAIFIPEIMKKMGMQGREQEVIQALQTMLQILTGNQNGIGDDDSLETEPPAPGGVPGIAKPVIAKKEKANGRRGQ